MTIGRWTILIALALPVAIPRLAASDPVAAGQRPEGEPFIARIDNAAATHVEVLKGLLPQVPEPARGGLTGAIESAREGHDVTIAALTAPARSRALGRDGRLDWSEIMRARRALSFSFRRSVSVLHKLIRGDVLPAGHAAEALARVRESRDVALQGLDRLLAVRAPGLWGGSPDDLAESVHAPRASRVGQQQEGGGHCHGGSPGSGSQGRPGGHS